LLAHPRGRLRRQGRRPLGPDPRRPLRELPEAVLPAADRGGLSDGPGRWGFRDAGPMTIFAMAIPFEPRSSQAGKRQEYKDALRRAAKARYSGAMIEDDEPLYLRIIWFHRVEPAKRDMDNLVAPIQNALEK